MTLIKNMRSNFFELTLYMYKTCPYCQKVVQFLEEIDLFIECKDIQRDSIALDELIQLTGASQVPCLVINGDPLLESDDIVKWLIKNF